MWCARDLCAFLVPAGLALAPEAQASPTVVMNPGLLLSGVAGDTGAVALGGEFSVLVFPRQAPIQEQLGFGAFLQAQSYALSYGRWAAAAREEQASVPAFLRLAAELSAHGAVELAPRARAAAREEARHARACLAVARKESGLEFYLGPVPSPPARRPELETLAVEAVTEGYVGEGGAASRARERAAQTRDPLARQALTLIAREEQAHAELGRDVVRFCVARGGRKIRSVSSDAAERCGVRLPL